MFLVFIKDKHLIYSCSEINGAGVITGVVMICVILTILVILKLTQMFCLKRFKQLLKSEYFRKAKMVLNIFFQLL